MAETSTGDWSVTPFVGELTFTVPVVAGTGGARLSGVLGELFADIRRHLAAGRQHVAKLPRAIGPAFLPLALVASYVRRLERAGGDVVRAEATILPLARVARMAAARWLGGI